MSKKKKISLKIFVGDIKTRYPVPPPGNAHKNKNKYSRQLKHKKDWDRNGLNPFSL